MMSMEFGIGTYLGRQIGTQGNVDVTNMVRVAGGASRETWMFDATWDAGEGRLEKGAFVLQKDPPVRLLRTAREAELAFYSAFRGSTVPVPQIRWVEHDPSILGGPFIITNRILGCNANHRPLLQPAYRALHAAIAARMYALLGEIATFAWRGTVIEQLVEAPTAETAWQKELGHWEGVVDAQELTPQPILRAAIRWLRRNPPPPAQQVSVVHGDYRVGNLLYRADGSIQGVLDWEMAHLGDPLEDLAWSLNPCWHFANDGRPGGIVDRATAISLWERASGMRADPGALSWWEILGSVKCHGIAMTAARSLQERRTHAPILATIAYRFGHQQDEFLLRTLGGGA